MTYRELIEQYKKGELDENQKAKVEADIERQDAISDYLYEEEMIPGMGDLLEKGTKDLGPSMEYAGQSEKDFVKMINKSIRKSFIKLGITVFTITIAVAIFIQFALPHIVSSFYYNPGKTIGENANKMSLDMAVYTELAIPLYVRDNVSVDANGYGDYDICIYQNVSYDNSFTNLTGKVNKGKLILYDSNILKRPTGNAFAWFQMTGDTSKSLNELVEEGKQIFCAAGNRQQATKTLQNLDENEKYIAYVTLNRMMDYEDFAEFSEEIEYFSPAWCAVCTNSPGEIKDSMFHADNIGFQYNLQKSTSLKWDKEKYPNLLLWDEDNVGDENTQELERKMKTEEFMKSHLVSMLEYMSEQKEFSDMMDEDIYSYKNAADYIQNHGIRVYGFTAIMDKKAALKANEMEEVYEIYTQPLR